MSAKTSLTHQARQRKIYRPYKIVRSMDPTLRSEIARSLRINLPDTAGTDEQAWSVLTKPMKGMQDRSRGYPSTALRRGGSYWDILKGAAKSVKVNAKASRYKILERRIFNKMAEEGLGKMSNVPPSSDEATFLKGATRVFRAKGFSAKGAEFMGRLLYKGIKKRGFNSFVDAVRLAGRANKAFGTKLVMSQVAKNLKWFLKGTNIIFWMWTAHDVLSLLFGERHSKNAIVVAQLYIFDMISEA